VPAAILVFAATSLLSAGPSRIAQSQTAAGQPRFSDVAQSAGLTFVHRHSPTADKHYPESVPGGVAGFDYNGDGRPDIFFTNGAAMPSLVKSDDGGMTFTDVIAAAPAHGRFINRPASPGTARTRS
jgi:hypothetical protein